METDDADRGRIEVEIARDVEDGAADLAARKALSVYGPEVFGFLVAVLRDDGGERSSEAYLQVMRHLGAEIADYDRRFDVRTWIYSVARRQLAVARNRRGAHERSTARGEDTPTSTIPNRPTALRGVVARVHERLTPEEREIVILRFDRGFGWRELASTSLGARASDAEIAAEAERLRAIVARIRALVVDLRASPE